MYCNREVAGLGGRCIAIHLVRLEIVLQEKESVLQESAVWLGKKLYCKTKFVLQ